MEIKQGASDVELFLKPRQDGVVIPMQSWATQYGEGDFLNGTYTLVGETADKTATIEIESNLEDTNGMFFTLPASMFVIAQRSWTMILKFLLNGKTDFSLYNFNINVSKGSSVNSR